MADEQDWGPAEPIRQAVHDLVAKFHLHIGQPAPPAQPQRVDPADVEAANKSFRDAADKDALNAQQAASIRMKAKR